MEILKLMGCKLLQYSIHNKYRTSDICSTTSIRSTNEILLIDRANKAATLLNKTKNYWIPSILM